MNTLRQRRLLPLLPLVALSAVLAFGAPLEAGVKTYRSRNFVVHTDVDAAATDRLLERLERMLVIISAYWKRPNRKKIECCVVQDLAAWPVGRLPPVAVKKIQGGSGLTLSLTRRQGNVSVTKSIVYAPAATSATQHEAVHAYAFQMFGSSGPIWYSEGMAEMGRYWQSETDLGIHAGGTVLRYLHGITPPKLRLLTRTGQTADSWQKYAQRWALCHLLANNPNYRTRFRVLGLGLLSRSPGVNFQKLFGSMEREIDFEYRIFLRDVQKGYRVDLCAWDFKTKFRRPRPGKPVSVSVAANRGWQASRVTVQKGKTYSVKASGTWRLAKDADPLDANGDARKRGRLEAVIFSNYRLTQAAPLGSDASFTPSQDGKLFLRCGDLWGRLADNSGSVQVSLTLEPGKKTAGGR